MPNPNVLYQRGNYALQTLVAEISARWGIPSRPYEFVTGYRAADNFTGHNADNNGVAHGVDIFVGPGNLSAANADFLTSFLRGEGTKGDIPGHPDRLYYIIYQDRIAGDFSNWEWVGAGYGHWDHIHVSTCDLFWGDVAPVHPLDYDNTSAWGLTAAATNPLSTTKPTPIQEDELTMANIETILGWINTIHNAVRDNATATNKKIDDTKAAIKGDIATVHNTIIRDVGGQLAGIREVIAQLPGGKDIDLAAVEAASKRGAEAAIAEGVVKVDVTIAGGDK